MTTVFLNNPNELTEHKITRSIGEEYFSHSLEEQPSIVNKNISMIPNFTCYQPFAQRKVT